MATVVIFVQLYMGQLLSRTVKIKTYIITSAFNINETKVYVYQFSLHIYEQKNIPMKECSLITGWGIQHLHSYKGMFINYRWGFNIYIPIYLCSLITGWGIQHLDSYTGVFINYRLGDSTFIFL